MDAKNNYAFIDSQNLNLAIREQGWVLDFKRFRRYLEDKYKIGKAFIFIGFIPQNQDLYTSLQKCGYILVFKPTLQLPDGKVKGNVDSELVLHAMIEYPNYDKALIVTGDGDFYCLVDYLIKNGKFLKLMIPNRHRYSSLFRKLMPYIVFMNELKGKLEHKKDQKKEALPRGRNPSDSLKS
ncbi:NYN domain-containing protein [Candidatus Peregrinibacteria bacterium]|nr:NYN domain-containing protein [Candidatus Peregrinibacteria bacterium]